MTNLAFPADRRDRRIRTLSRVLAWCCLAACLLLPAAIVYVWATVTPEHAAARFGLASGAVQLDSWQRGVGVVLTMLPAGLMMLALLRARRCFAAFAAGAFFTADAVRGLRGFAAGAFASALAVLPASSLTSVLLTIGNPSGERHLTVQLGSEQAFTLFVAGLVWLIAWVMARAVQLAEENAQFV